MSDTQTLESVYAVQRKKYQLFTEQLPLEAKQPFYQAGMVWGVVEGNVTPRILILALESGHWEYSDDVKLDDLTIELLSEFDDEASWPSFIVLVDQDDNQKLFSFIDGASSSIDEIPSIDLIRDYKSYSDKKRLKWSAHVYRKLMSDLDQLHEQIYHTVKEGAGDKNAIIEEVVKFLFLESLRVHHQEGDLVFDFKGEKISFHDIFDYRNFESKSLAEQKLTVSQIQAAFDTFKNHEDYITTDDNGRNITIFSDRAYLALAQPKNYETLLKAIQDLGDIAVKNEKGETIVRKGTLADVSADFLGRTFDVFLRGNFDSKGGFGVYLTPKPVKEAMLEIVFSDLERDPEFVSRLVSGEFKFADPACGTYGFGSVALRYIRQFVCKIASSDIERSNILQTIFENGLIGSDNSERMVMLARVNMALQGAPRAKIFSSADSLMNSQLKPNSIDLICTNPPFGTPKLTNTELAESRMEFYRSDLHDISTGKKPKYELRATTKGLALGSKANDKGEWVPAKASSTDLSVLFIDRCLQLLKPGGRLMIVLPDGILCNSKQKYVREYIMGKKDPETGEFTGGKAIIKAVISLPADTFKLSGTGAKTSILYIQKRPASPDNPEQFLPEPQGDVFMAVAETLGYVVKNKIEDYAAGVPNDLNAIVGAYKRGE